jgi:hypothetical protein
MLRSREPEGTRLKMAQLRQKRLKHPVTPTYSIPRMGQIRTRNSDMNATKILAFAATACITTALAAPASAQHRVDTVEYVGPDRTLLRTGVWTLGLSYVPALVVAIESPVPEDKYLYAPVAGPWLDLSKRDCSTCEHETLNKVLLVTDGIIQGIGSLEIIGSLLFIERSTVSTAGNPAPKLVSEAKSGSGFRLRFAPRRMAGGYGLAAVGTF